MADLTAMMQSAAGNAGGDANFIEDVFSTYLYTGTGANQTITNGIDLAGEGGLVWIKYRNQPFSHFLVDTARGVNKRLVSNNADAEASAGTVSQFNSDGYVHDAASNALGENYVSWTFRKQPKFFDVVTYTGNGVAGRQIAHDLGSVPGFVLIKSLSTANSWVAWHRSTSGQTGRLNETSAFSADQEFFLGNNTIAINPTSTVLTVASGGASNFNGTTYVAYLFAHDAGGFGLSGEDNVISCGSYVGAGTSGVEVNVGFEPQWLLIKGTTLASSWSLLDNMRGIVTNGEDNFLYASASVAESPTVGVELTSTGFISATTNGNVNEPANTYIYIAIRRGPMKVPETGTSVFAVDNLSNPSTSPAFISGFPVDMALFRDASSTYDWETFDRLRGTPNLRTNSTTAELTSFSGLRLFDFNNGFYPSGVATTFYSWMFRRAPGFFDEVCYTGTGTSGRAIPHNLAAIPELIICKQRSSSGTRNWIVYAQPLGVNKYLYLNLDIAAPTITNVWGSQTSTTFGVENFAEQNDSGQTFVAYLFASVPGVSKVGSYTGTGTTQIINCGFTAGSRFIMIKRTDSTGNWYVWDSARGIVAGNDPYLLLNSTAAEVTNTDFVDPASVGFEISSTAPAEINASGGTYIFLAIA